VPSHRSRELRGLLVARRQLVQMRTTLDEDGSTDCYRASGSERLERERLSPDRRLEHQPFLAGREDADAIGELGVRPRPGLERDRGRLRGELHVPALEVVQRGFVLERDDLRVALASECHANGRLRKIAVPDLPALLEHYTRSGSSPPAVDREPRVATPVTASDQAPSTFDAVELPPDLIEELGQLLARALVADLKQYPNLAALKAARASTVESPPGPNRSDHEAGGPSGGHHGRRRRDPGPSGVLTRRKPLGGHKAGRPLEPA
jgi:hypothetical protein